MKGEFGQRYDKGGAMYWCVVALNVISRWN